MKGAIKKVDDIWIVECTLFLHSDNVKYIKEMKNIFDNIEARIFSHPFVEFEEKDGHAYITEFTSTEEMDKGKLTMVFGDDSIVYKNFNCEYPEDNDFLNKNNGKVNLSCIGFAEEWSNLVDFEKSYSYIDNGKLYVVVYGLPEYLNKKSVYEYYGKTLDHYIKQGFGEFFETEPACPICMIVEINGDKVIV